MFQSRFVFSICLDRKGKETTKPSNPSKAMVATTPMPSATKPAIIKENGVRAVVSIDLVLKTLPRNSLGTLSWKIVEAMTFVGVARAPDTRIRAHDSGMFLT